MEPLKIVEKFQCPGCVCGADTSSGCYEPESGYFHCSNHVPGTIASGIGTINLGLPKGFNRIGGGRLSEGSGRIRLFKRFDDHPGYNHLNVPVWVMEKSEDGIDFLIVRCYMPRVDCAFVDVILNGKLDDVRKIFPDAIDVSTFIDQID